MYISKLEMVNSSPSSKSLRELIIEIIKTEFYILGLIILLAIFYWVLEHIIIFLGYSEDPVLSLILKFYHYSMIPLLMVLSYTHNVELLIEIKNLLRSILMKDSKQLGEFICEEEQSLERVGGQILSSDGSVKYPTPDIEELLDPKN